MLQALEDRTLFSAIHLSADGVLGVTGSGSADQISVSVKKGRIYACVNGTHRWFSPASVARVSVNGGAGDDRINLGGIAIPTTLKGGAGNDSLIGGSAADRIYGNSGDDQLFGGAGNDRLDGGLGADLLSGGAGTDAADYSTRTENLALSLDGMANDGAAGIVNADTSSEFDNIDATIECILSGKGNDHLEGSTNADYIDAGGGNDTIYGLAGRDTLCGGAGNDFISGDEDTDRLNGGAGNDSLYGQGGKNNFLIGGDGDDLLDMSNGSTSDAADGGAGKDIAIRDWGPGDDGMGDINFDNIRNIEDWSYTFD
jgi:Ca2+-binding RTX toxin-like protein